MARAQKVPRKWKRVIEEAIIDLTIMAQECKSLAVEQVVADLRRANDKYRDLAGDGHDMITIGFRARSLDQEKLLQRVEMVSAELRNEQLQLENTMQRVALRLREIEFDASPDE